MDHQSTFDLRYNKCFSTVASIIGILDKVYGTFMRLTEFEYPDFYIENAVRQSAVFTSSNVPNTVRVRYQQSLLQYEKLQRHLKHYRWLYTAFHI